MQMPGGSCHGRTAYHRGCSPCDVVRVGVTGATGFIGGALVPHLARLGYDLVPVDDRSGPVVVEYPEWPALDADFASAPALNALSDCDVILHLGAVSGVMISAQEPERTARVNIEGTRRLLELCRERRIPLAFASSFAVVGRPERLPVTEDTPARPTHEYARQKAAGESLVQGLAESGRVPSATLRMSNVYGGYAVRGRSIAKGNVIELFARQAQSGRLTVNAPGTQRRDFIHLEDVLSHWEALVRFLQQSTDAPVARTFNAASGEALSVLEVAGKVQRAYAILRPNSETLAIDLVPNPREGIELVEPGFAVNRDMTERVLGVTCRFTLDRALPSILGGPASSVV
jgi:UDP-glucose 4-epimerase